MSDRLELAEKYYAVARDLEIQARAMLDTVEFLNRSADQLCEKNIREANQPTSNTSCSLVSFPEGK